MPRSLIVSFGSVNIDVTARTRRLPRPGETVHAESYTLGLGGKGANQAAAAGRLGLTLGIRSALVGRVGQDAFAAQARASLSSFHVDLSALRTDATHPTGLALIGVDDAGENSIMVAGGANMAVSTDELALADTLFAQAGVVLLQLEIPLDSVIAGARRGRGAGARVILDPAPAPEHGLPEDLWPLIDVITPNENETACLTGLTPTTPEEAAHAATLLLARGVKGVLVKMGARGVWWQDTHGGGFIPPFPVTAIDSVAAGDCFNAGLAVGLTQGLDLAGATRVAAACGALATTRMGAADSAPQWDEVMGLLSAHS